MFKNAFQMPTTEKQKFSTEKFKNQFTNIEESSKPIKRTLLHIITSNLYSKKILVVIVCSFCIKVTWSVTIFQNLILE